MSCYSRALQAMILPSGNYDASNYGVSPNVSDNGPALNALIATVRGTSRGGRIWLEPGPYTFTTPIVDPGGAAIELIGSGTDNTYFQATGSLLSSGDLITPKRYFRAFGMTFGATATRSAGALVKVVGDMLVTEVPSRKLQNFEFGDVNLENGFNGFHLVDGGSDLSVCGFFWDGGHATAHGFAAGGTVFYCDTGNGAGSTHGGVVISLQNVTHYETSGVIDANRPDATVRVRGCADLRMYHVESFYARRGCVIDPPAAARASAVFMTSCVWGATTQAALYVAPNATAESAIYQMVGGYIDAGGIYLGANAKGFYAAGVVLSGNTTAGVELDGCSGVTLTGIMGSGANAKVIWAHNNAKNFTVDGSMRDFFGVNTTGIHIEAGCDKYQVNMVGGEYCTTPKSAPADDATKVCSIF